MEIPMTLLRLLILLIASAALSQAADIRISGLKSMSRGEALRLLGDRLELIKQKPANVSRAADAAFMLESLMKLQGYAHASVTGAVEGAAIRLTVTEGSRQYFGDIAIEGIDDKERKKLTRLFTSNAEKRLLAFAPSVPFLEEDVSTGISYLQQEWQSRGYWSAQVRERKRTERKDGKVDFVLEVDRGPLHILNTAVISGNLPHYRKTLIRKLSRFTGTPATAAHINEMRSVTETLYRKHGYTEANIRLSGEPREGTFTPEISVALGERYRLSEIMIEGLDKTKRERVATRFDGMAGEYYDATRTDREVRKLLNTGAFQSVRFETSSVAGQETLDATLHLVEGKARSFSSYAGFETYEGPILGVGYTDRNLWGNLWNLSGGLELSQRGMLFDTRIVDPWFMNTDLRAGARFFAVNRDLDVYQKFESGFSFDFTWDLTEHDSLMLFIGSSFVNITDSLIASKDLGATSYSHNRVRLTWTHDQRNNKLSPSDGWMFDAAGELGTVIGNENASYAKWEMRGSYYIPIKETNHVALGLRSGMLVPATPGDLPIDLRYFEGGPNSVRSFPARELGPRNIDDVTVGGEAYWVANAEYVHQVAGPVKAVAFTDVGTLSADFATFGFSTFDIAAGVGVRLDLPIGPVRLEYGHNLTPDPGEPSGAFHFAIGVAF